MVGYIYYISNTVNNKLYVGKTISTLKERLGEHRRESRKQRTENRPLYRAMRKYGEDKFSIHLLEKVPFELLSEREMYWIDKLDTYANGYNATRGGEGKILLGEDLSELFIQDYRSGMNLSQIAEKHGCDMHTVLNRLRSVGINTKENAINQRKFKINQYDLNGKFIQSFSSFKDAARYLANNGVDATLKTISACVGRAAKGKLKTYHGFIWVYADES